MAPEQLMDGRVSVRSDIYTLGLILHELFTGQCVFETDDIEELKRQHSSGSVSRPSSITEAIDPAVERVIMRCLHEDPEQRPQSVYQVLAALPGGDPLAAALAAGELPSPELVANARDVVGLRPPVAVGLLAILLVSLAVTWFVYAGTTAMPERSPAELSLVAKQVMEELGYDDLLRTSVFGYDVNSRLAQSLRSSPRSVDGLAALDWPPRFRFWRRWTPGAFLSRGFHDPNWFAIDGETFTPTGTATVAIDSAGVLLGLRVSPTGSPIAPASREDIDWSPLFRLANLGESDAVAIPLRERPPVDCEQSVAWRIERRGADADPVTVQMGAVEGRLNYFEILGVDEAMASVRPEGGYLTTMSRSTIVLHVMRIIMILLAWRNLLAYRADWRNALRYAAIVGLLYAVVHLLSTLLQDGVLSAIRQDRSLLEKLMDGSDTGHVLLHMLDVWVVYVAIEPYVRRVWPRMLVGIVRALSGRLRDPAVGREVLIGAVVGCGLAAVVAIMWLAEAAPRAGAAGHLPSGEALASRSSPVQFLCVKVHRGAWTMLDTIRIAGVLVFIRLIVRHTLAALLVSIALFGLTAHQWFMDTVGGPWWLGLPYAIAFGVALVMLYTRVGVLAAMTTLFVLLPHRLFGLELDAWYTPYSLAVLAIPIVLAAYGFWVELAGQPLFKDMLAEPQPAR
jgi:serine/threonine-protein kinase